MKDYLLIFRLVPSIKRSKLTVLVALIFFSILAELIGITLIIPIISSFTDNASESFKILNENYFIFRELKKLNFNELMIVLLLVFVVKSLFLIIVNYFTQSFVAEVQKEITNSIFIKNLKKDYKSFINENSSDKTRNIIEVTNSYIYQCLMPLVVLITEASFVIVICIFLFFLDPLSLFLVLAVISVLLFLYFKIINKKLFYWGKEKQFFLSMRLKALREAIEGIILIKTSNITNFFYKKFERNSNTSIDLTKRLLFLNNTIKVFLELFTIIILVGLIFFLLNREFSKLEILSLLSLYAVCAFKLLPSANRITVNLQNLKFGSPVLTILSNELFQKTEEKIKADREFRIKENLTFKDVSYNYNLNQKVFDKINIQIKKFDFIGIVGESGSGKSTFVNLLCGLLKPTEGKIYVDNSDINNLNFNPKNLIGYVPQKLFLIDDTVKANITLGIENLDNNKIIKLIKDSNFSNFIEKLPSGLDTIIGEDGNKLSVGQKQRLSILRALYNDPDILIFDEATSALDSNNEKYFLDLVGQLKGKKTIIFITHKKELLNSFDKIYEIRNKQFVKIK